MGKMSEIDLEIKERTKLEKFDKIRIILHSIMAIFSIITAIVEKNLIWILVGLLWINIATIEYCDNKLLKKKDLLIYLQEQYIRRNRKRLKK